MPDLDIDLTREHDTVLDGMLDRLYAEHRHADGEAREEAHLKIMAIVTELNARDDQWMAERSSK